MCLLIELLSFGVCTFEIHKVIEGEKENQESWLFLLVFEDVKVQCQLLETSENMLTRLTA